MLPSSSRRAQHDGRSSSTSRPGGDDDAQPRTRSIHDYIEALPIQHVNVFWPEAQRPSWLWPWPFPDTSLRIDTPSNETSQPRHLAGWVTRGGPQEVVIVVSGILSAAQVRDHALKPAEEYLDVDLERADPGRLISRVSLVGEVQCGRERGPPPSIKGKERESGSVAWLTVRSMSRKGRNGPGRRGKGPAFPSITSITLRDGSAAGGTARPSVSVCMYKPPDPSVLRFLSLEPLSLDLSPPPQDAEDAVQQRILGDNTEQLIAARPARWFEVTGGFPLGTGPGSGLRKAVELINAAHQTNRRFCHGRTDTLQSPLTAARKVLRRIVSLQSEGIIAVCVSLQSVLHRPLHRDTSLVDISCTAAQLSLRFEQISSFPTLAADLRRLRRNDEAPIRVLAARYIAVWNGLWLIANDVILGWAAASLLCEHHQPIGEYLAPRIHAACVQDLMRGLRWLDAWPGGLKLNTELSAFFSDMYLGLTMLFQSLLLSPLLGSGGSGGQAGVDNGHASPFPAILYALGSASRFLGLSVLLCLGVDLARLLTLHLTILHRLAAAQYRATLHLLSLLLLIFRGKKHNILSLSRGAAAPRRPPTTAAAYDPDQLLLGTILFALVLFLAPTIAAYHALFACAAFGVELLAVGGVYGCAVERGMNRLPLLAVMLRAKDPERVPAGLEVRRVREGGSDEKGEVCALGELRTTKYELVSRPLSYSEVLFTGPGSASGSGAASRVGMGMQAGIDAGSGSSPPTSTPPAAKTTEGHTHALGVTGMVLAIFSGRPVQWRAAGAGAEA